jgi:hypothetical protein
MLCRFPRSLLVFSFFTCCTAGAAPSLAKIDPCKTLDPVAFNTIATDWFGMPVTLSMTSTPGPRGGTCDFSTETPKHIDILVFYTPNGIPDNYGLGETTPPKETLVDSVGDRAVYDFDTTPTNKYKSQNLSILSGKAIIVLSLTIDQKLPLVSRLKLADFANEQLLPKF